METGRQAETSPGVHQTQGTVKHSQPVTMVTQRAKSRGLLTSTQRGHTQTHSLYCYSCGDIHCYDDRDTVFIHTVACVEVTAQKCVMTLIQTILAPRAFTFTAAEFTFQWVT